MDENKFSSEMSKVLEYPLAHRHEETAFYFYTGPESSAAFRAFAASRPNEVVYHEIPASPGGKGKAINELFMSLLETMGDPTARNRGDSYTKARKLARRREALGTRMLILDGAHRMVTPGRGTPLLSDFYALVSYLKAQIMPDRTSVVILGERPTIDLLIGQDAWVVGRFSYLPSEVKSLPRDPAGAITN